MRLLALAMKELRDILSERLYLFAFLVQLLIVVSITFVALLYASLANPEVMEEYVPPQQVRIGVVGNASLLELENLAVVELDIAPSPWRTMEEHRLVALLLVSPASSGGVKLTLYIDNTNILSGYADAVVSRAAQRLEEELQRARASELGVSPEALLSPVEVRVVGTGSAAPEFVELFYGLLLPFILLLPAFLAANMTTDAIVGEKERRTYELLLTAPLSYRELVLGKALPVAAVALAQGALWMGLLELRGIEVHNKGLLLLLLALLNLLFIATGVAISAFSDSIKDANVGVTAVLILASLGLFLPATARGYLSEISPVTLMARLASSEAVYMKEVLPGFALLAAASLAALLLGERLLEYRENLRV
ncbi:MAG: ABC transporter permease [Euryarchaeota archaeon]|nr:ABC transporter permease [Euryarchaeota archaeon]